MSPPFGFLEFIAVLVSLGDAGVSANPRAPAAAEVMKYAPDEADFMTHVDVEALVPGNYRAIKALPGQEVVRKSPQAGALVESVVRDIGATASMLKGLTGIDPLTDIHSLTLWLELPAEGDPRLLLVVRGAMSADVVERIGRAVGGRAVQIEGQPALASPDGSLMLAFKGKELLLGTPAWVTPRLAASWRPAAFKGGSAPARIADALKARPFLMLASRPSTAAVTRLTRDMKAASNVLADVVRGHELAIVSLLHNGLAWTVVAREASGYERALMVHEGLVEVLRAGHHATRGLARLGMASLRSYAGVAPEIDAILQNEAQIVKLVSSFSGDGSFQAEVKKSPAQRLVEARATGKKLSDVVPVLGLAPLVGALLLPGQAVASPAQAARPIEPRPAVPGLDVQGVYQSVKRAQGL